MRFGSLLFATLLPALASAQTQASRVTLDAPALARIDSVARSFIAARKAAGLSVALVQDGRLVFDSVYGKANLEHDVAATKATPWRIFSITKTYTAAAILQLAEQGRLSLDDKVEKHFPGFPRGNEVTLRHLLSHTSGIADYARPGELRERWPITSEQIVAMVRTRGYDFDPGTKYAYSNSNYALLGRIIEQRTGQSWADYVLKSVVAKAGAQPQTRVDHTDEVIQGRAQGYVRSPSSPTGFANGPAIEMSFPWAAGSLLSTTADLAAWFTALFDGRIVSRASLAEMTKLGPHDYYGLGLEMRSHKGHRYIGHGGSFPSFNSVANNYVDDGFMLFILANTGMAAVEMEQAIIGILFP